MHKMSIYQGLGNPSRCECHSCTQIRAGDIAQHHIYQGTDGNWYSPTGIGPALTYRAPEAGKTNYQ